MIYRFLPISLFSGVPKRKSVLRPPFFCISESLFHTLNVTVKILNRYDDRYYHLSGFSRFTNYLYLILLLYKLSIFLYTIYHKAGCRKTAWTFGRQTRLPEFLRLAGIAPAGA